MLDASLFLDHLHKGGGSRSRVNTNVIWNAFASSFPQLITAADARVKVWALLDSLAVEGRIKLPRGRNGWDSATKPSLPKWVELKKAANPKNRISMAEIPWPPELRFACNLPSSAHLETLLRIKNWLANGGRSAEPVPIKERSVEIFHDEKKLDRLAKTGLFLSEGQLTLDLLRCYPVYPSLTWEAVPQPKSKTLLIVENMATYHSFSRWNQIQRRYLACIYGAGLTVHRTFDRLRETLAVLAPNQIEYFGDLDATGLNIPRQLSELSLQAGFPSVEPAVEWYTRLLQVFREDKVKKADPGSFTDAELSWLPENLRPRVSSIFATGFRVPQELVGWQYLHSLSQRSPGESLGEISASP